MVFVGPVNGGFGAKLAHLRPVCGVLLGAILGEVELLICRGL